MGRKGYESKFIAELRRSFKYYAYLQEVALFWHKISDTKAFGEENARPFDLEVIHSGITYKIEAKCHREHTAWPLAKVEKHQHENLLLAEQAGAPNVRSYIALKVYYGQGRAGDKFAAMIPVTEYLLWFKNLGRKSIPIEQIKDSPNVVLLPLWPVNGENLWNVGEFLDNHLVRDRSAMRRVL